MRNFRILLVVFVMTLGGCVAYTMTPPGENEIGNLRIATPAAWNKAPSAAMPLARLGSQVWTKNGLALDRLIIIPGVPDGEPIFRSTSRSLALPEFRADMLPNELEELTESSLTKLMGEGGSSVSMSNLRPYRFGERRGILMNFECEMSDGPNYRGIAGQFIHEDKLYAVIFLAADPHYYDIQMTEAESIIKSARL